MTNREKLEAMTDEELAEYLFYRWNGSEHCYGICAYQYQCEAEHAQEFCISQIMRWLSEESEGDSECN